MKEFENNAYFWQKVDTLYSSGDFTLTNKKGTPHPTYPSLVYPCDFGYVRTLNSENEAPMEKGRCDRLMCRYHHQAF